MKLLKVFDEADDALCPLSSYLAIRHGLLKPIVVPFVYFNARKAQLFAQFMLIVVIPVTVLLEFFLKYRDLCFFESSTVPNHSLLFLGH